MPPVVAGIAVAIAAYSGTTVAIGSVFLSATFAGTALGGFIAGAIGGAIIGAAVGGLTAAVMGGDIGQGILYGGIGGAVIGGIGGYFQGTTATSVGMSENAMAGQIASTGKGFAGQGVTTGIGAGTSGEMSKLLIEKGLEPALTMGGSALMGADEADMAKDARAHEAIEREKDRQLQKDLVARNSKYSSGGGGSNDGLAIAKIQQETELKKLAEQRRQYDVQRQDSIQARGRAASAVQNMRASRGRYKLDPNADEKKSFEEAAMEDQVQLPGVGEIENRGMLNEGYIQEEEAIG
jgi:hypothetical protein